MKRKIENKFVFIKGYIINLNYVIYYNSILPYYGFYFRFIDGTFLQIIYEEDDKYIFYKDYKLLGDILSL